MTVKAMDIEDELLESGFERKSGGSFNKSARLSEAKGSYLLGTYLGSRTVENKKFNGPMMFHSLKVKTTNAPIYENKDGATVATKATEGETVDVGGSAVLNSALTGVAFGSEVYIKYLGKKNRANLFDVLVKPKA